MMQPTLPPSPKTASSIFEAIKDGDWEGLLALYATTAYDAVHSAEFARRGAGSGSVGSMGFHRQTSLMAALAGGGRNGIFRDEKKLDGAPQLTTSPQQSLKPSPASSFSSSSPVHELNDIVREIIGAEIFDSHHDDNGSDINNESQEQNNALKEFPRVSQQPNKKTRQHSPTRKSPPGLSSALDNILFPSPSSSSNRRSEKEMDWEKIMWESASILTNSRPSPSFNVTRQDRNQREEEMSKVDNTGGKFMEGVTTANKNTNNQTQKNSEEEETNPNPLFEGNVANATPGDLIDGGTGAGTSQHLACLLDSPFALAILIVLGVNAEARHTAFRRLAIHEAACADSPRCLGLLMEMGTRFSMEIFRDVGAGSGDASSAIAASAGGGGAKSPSTHMFESSTSLDAASANGFSMESFGSARESFSSDMEERTFQRKSSKKKLNPFLRWNKGKKSVPDDCAGKTSEFTPFPVTLRVMWEAAKFLASGEMTEMDAAHYILDRVRVSHRAMMILALQCPHHLQNAKQDEDKVASPFASIPGLSAMNHIFQPNHRDMQSTFIKRNVDGHGNTPLHWAAFKASLRAMDVILSYNVDVNMRAQPSGWTPLHDAAYSDASDAVERLIAAGATIDARSHSGATPLCFAAQEDAPNATRMLLKAGADPAMRCLGNSPGVHVRANNADNNAFHSRFSGYTPLHYCAHYNASKAARVLLYESSRHHHLSAIDLLEIPDLNDKLPIHVAVARGSSLVLKELLHGGARVETASHHPPPSPRARAIVAELAASPPVETAPVAIPTDNDMEEDANNESSTNGLSVSPTVVTPVSSPILRAMIPSQPITSSKPWNCLSQKSIDACKHLIEEVEMNWTPERHTLFSPADRVAVVEVLHVGKRLEQVGRGIFLDLWPHVLSFCGRGWFEPLEEEPESKVPDEDQGYSDEEEISRQCLDASIESAREEMEEFTQFQLEGTNTMPSIL